MKEVVFLGGSLADLRGFPDGPRRQAGFQIERIQRGLDPDDWKPMKTIGPGVREIRIGDKEGAFRVIYVAAFAEAVYVLHAFAKKSQSTARPDLALAAKRLADLRRSRSDE